MTGKPEDRRRFGIHELGHIRRKRGVDARRAHVEAAVIRLAVPAAVHLTRVLSLDAIVIVQEAVQIADVEVRAPFLFGAVCAAHEDRDDLILLAVVVRHLVMTEEDLGDVVVAVRAEADIAVEVAVLQLIVDDVLHAVRAHERVDAPRVRDHAAVAVIERLARREGDIVVVRKLRRPDREACDRRVVSRVVSEEVPVIHGIREVDREVAALVRGGEVVASRQRIQIVPDAVEVGVNKRRVGNVSVNRRGIAVSEVDLIAFADLLAVRNAVAVGIDAASGGQRRGKRHGAEVLKEI